MASIRKAAVHAGTAKGAAQVFNVRCGLDLEQLRVLFLVADWKRSCGGEKWASICSKVRELVDALEARDEDRIQAMLGELRRARHNNGLAARKLRDLMMCESPPRQAPAE